MTNDPDPYITEYGEELCPTVIEEQIVHALTSMKKKVQFQKICPLLSSNH